MSERSTGAAASLVLYDDHVARRFEPFALTRPIASLLAGTAEGWTRWQTALQMPAAGVIAAPHLAEFDEAPGCVSGVLPRGTVVANSRFAPAYEVLRWRGAPMDATGTERSESADAADSWWAGGRIAAVRLDRDVPVAELEDGSLVLEALLNAAGPRAELVGWWHDEVWDFIRYLPAAIADDIDRMRMLPLLRSRIDAWEVPAQATVLGAHAVIVHGDTPGAGHPPAAVIEPHVLLDATAGPIYVAYGAHVRAFTRLNGPCYIGPHTTVAGGEISNSSVGPRCKVRGEISSSLFLGYSNKGHEGFVGHSYIGRWVNLGAGTTTSNLKNTYGSVSLWTPDGIRATDMQFLGTLFGDHAKTGIGTMLTTGTVLGAGANVFGARMPPKVVPPFAWGSSEPYEVYHLDKFIENAERMMHRRDVAVTGRMRRQLSASHSVRWTADPSR
jgi:UDP-N-acetylglucosamine diphosphorylase / glucose-1-phosphate thymidylyltransferase / UDP-N-acetylgalactosamine diphosphorylase / glucosamine-1-phosphate N-acetyltransferase / galactosamine-1-phosphate N-acetyltransferase